MPTISAGILPLRVSQEGALQFFLVHPGGPFFRKKDDGIWSISKGLVEGPTETYLDAARRELGEETGFPVPKGPYLSLGSVVQRGGKQVHAWAVMAPEFDPAKLASNSFEMEWPPKSGRKASFPEVDRADWFGRSEAERKILPSQLPFLGRSAAPGILDALCA